MKHDPHRGLLKENGHKCRGCNSMKIVLHPFGKGVCSKVKEFAPFPIRVDSFSVGAWVAGKQTDINTNCLPCQTCQKIYKSVSSPLKEENMVVNLG